MEKEKFNATQNKKDFLRVDYKEIETFVTEHEEEYNALMQRFISGDESLTKDELKMVYFGSYFSSKYDYEEPSDELKEAMTVRHHRPGQLPKSHCSEINDPSYVGDKRTKVVDLCRQELEKSPVNLELLRVSATVAERLHWHKRRWQIVQKKIWGEVDESLPMESEEAALYNLRRSQILNMIMETGDGKTQETAFKIISVSDEYEILKSMYGVGANDVMMQSLIGDNYDRLTIEQYDPEKTIAHVFFDVSLHMRALEELLKD